MPQAQLSPSPQSATEAAIQILNMTLAANMIAQAISAAAKLGRFDPPL